MNIAVGANPQQSIRRALGVLKDSTAVGLVKVNSDYKDLDVAIVKATNHFEVLPKEKHIRTIYQAISASRSRADVSYCIHNLVKRLARTSNWAVALKTLVVIHRALRETDWSFREELLRYRRTRAQMLNLSHFKDDSSTIAWNYSAWVRTYALFLEERLECSQILKYDIESEPNRVTDLETRELLEQLPALQNLLFRLIGCLPEGAAVHNQMIRFAVSMVAQESIKIYAAIKTGTVNLADKFFDMQRHDAIRALDIYRKAVRQAENLSDFYKICRKLALGRVNDYKKVEQPPGSFLEAMEEYIKNVPRRNMLENGRETPMIQYKNNKEAELPAATSLNLHEVILPKIHTHETTVQPALPESIADLLCLDGFRHDSTAHDVDETNSLALSLISNEAPASNACVSSNPTYVMEDWELALVAASSSKQSSLPELNLGDGFNKLTLDSLYENSVAQGQTNDEFATTSDQVASANPFEMIPFSDNPFFVHSDEISSTNMEPGTNWGHDDLFFLSTTETVTSNNTSVGLDTRHTNSFSLPINGESVPGNNVPIGTEMGHDDPFFLSNTVTVPSNSLFEAETNHGIDAALQMQGQENSHGITKNPFGNPFI
ncbi:ENTH/ANTH/VHS superfamily protein [Rhynchospora pubera]|uniref:ENTH/ANTH/VHS superfamily protein n=1 Tax=Rhynchospora pubera TaxID=906938 RepID=A0AAV8BXV6_9POAL|nr:ENTH/ANTH/VHS superfamily protein [Rhynchospora pubera]